MEYFLSIAITHFLSVASPGISTFAVIKTGLVYGIKQSKQVGISTALVDVLYAIIAIVGLSEIISASPKIAYIIRMISGVYLIALGCYIIYTYFKEKSQQNDYQDGIAIDGKNFYLYGMTIGLINIRILIFYVAIFSEVTAHINNIEKIGYIIWITCVNLLCYFLVAHFTNINNIRNKMLSILPFLTLAFGIFLIYSGIGCLT